MSMTLEMEGGGRLRMWEEAGRVFFRCERELSREGLYKVWVRGDGGELLLGTLAPEGERLVLYRTLWPMELRRCGCWPVRAARCTMTYAFARAHQDGWYWEEYPQRLVDGETAQMGEWRRMLCSREGDELLLAWPVRRDTPLPLAHLFCLAVVQRVRGEICLIWRFDAQGRPILPGMLGADGQSESK